MNPQLTTRLRHLRLSGMVEALPGRVAQAEAAPLPYLEFLELLVEDELARRADRLFARRLKQAGIVVEKTLADFEWTFNPKIPKTKIVELAKLNSRHGVGAMYHTHSGVDLVGASIWDLHELLDGLDPASVGINYDVGHATIEGGVGGWINSFRISGEHLRGIAVKDFVWEKKSSGEWHPVWKPLGNGMVHLRKFFGMVAAASFRGPLQLHFEYPLGGAESGKRHIAISQTEVFQDMKRDLGRLRGYLQQSHLS